MKHLKKFLETNRTNEWIEGDIQDMLDKMDKSCKYGEIHASILQIIKFGGDHPAWGLNGWQLTVGLEYGFHNGDIQPIILTQNQQNTILEIVNYMKDRGFTGLFIRKENEVVSFYQNGYLKEIKSLDVLFKTKFKSDYQFMIDFFEEGSSLKN